MSWYTWQNLTPVYGPVTVLEPGVSPPVYTSPAQRRTIVHVTPGTGGVTIYLSNSEGRLVAYRQFIGAPTFADITMQAGQSIRVMRNSGTDYKAVLTQY